MGDFNTCLLKNDNRSEKLSSLIYSHNLHILPLAATHHQPHCTPSLLDLIIVSNPELVSSHGQLSAPFSYHDLIFLSFKIRRPKRQHKFILLRSFKNIDMCRLRFDVENMDWSPVFLADSVDGKVAAFNEILIALYDHHAPVKRVRIKHAPAPWLTPSIKAVMTKRNKAKRSYKKHPTEEYFLKYKKLRNRCTKMCRDAKRHYIHDSLKDCSSAGLWSFVRSLGVGKQDEHQSITFDLDAINCHFSKSPLVIDAAKKQVTLDAVFAQPKPNCPSFEFSLATVKEVERCLKSISTKAEGTDGIQILMLKPIISELSPIITHILNYSITSSVFPTSWKSAYIIPLPKTSNPSSVTQYRPISILPTLSKVLESIIQNQLYGFFSSHGLLSCFQSGFRPCHSTVSALVKVSDDIRWAMDNKLVSILVLLDFSSAFNSVDHDILLGILSSLNISNGVVAWFRSYLSGRTQCVRTSESRSGWCNITAGVPQGAVLSPLLFSIFINAITKALSCNFHLYADDLQIYRHSPASEIEVGIELINSDLKTINDWASSYGLLVNPSKSQALMIGSPHMLNVMGSPPTPVKYDNIPLNFSKSSKNLGVIFDSTLSWSSHVNDISKKIYYSFQSLKRLQKFLPLKTKIILAQSLLLPILDYADVCFLDVTEELLNKLERLQNLGIRFIYGLRKYDHVSEFRQQLKWLPIRERRNLHILCFLYKILFNPSSPPYLRERFEWLVPRGEPCRTSKSMLLRVPSHATSKYGKSFTVRAVTLWNKLPHAIRTSKTAIRFKDQVKEHYLSTLMS